MHIFFPFSAFSIQPFLSLTLSYTSLSFSFSPIFLSVSSSPPFSTRFPSTNSPPPPPFSTSPSLFFLAQFSCSLFFSCLCFLLLPFSSRFIAPSPFLFFITLSLFLSFPHTLHLSLYLSLPLSFCLSHPSSSYDPLSTVTSGHTVYPARHHFASLLFHSLNTLLGLMSDTSSLSSHHIIVAK